ncbi:DUF3824 domain-containing protein [Enterobacter cancerogenus]|uniref:DUF3824 domain-containing protein n=1 Tax=Enterobacter cancerogenus TaxID=69218 RepID=UPI000690A76B|nr:DUF3824 domain-containing protein [Enterobacter cancerogenus]
MQADDIASGIADAVSHPLTVQVINQGPGIWGNVATGLITAGAAIGAVMLTHKFTLRREKSASEEKQQRERYFIATELVFLLERFSEGCVPVASDAGKPDEQQGRWYAETDFPSFDFTEVSGDWRSLPQRLIYQLRELFIQQEAAKRIIQSAFEFDDPMEPTEGFFTRQYQATRLGLRALILATRLRKVCGMPNAQLLRGPSSAGDLLLLLWRKHHRTHVSHLIQTKLFWENVQSQLKES